MRVSTAASRWRAYTSMPLLQSSFYPHSHRHLVQPRSPVPLLHTTQHQSQQYSFTPHPRPSRNFSSSLPSSAALHSRRSSQASASAYSTVSSPEENSPNTSFVPLPEGPLEAYKKLLLSGQIHEDLRQLSACHRLQRLHEAMHKYRDEYLSEKPYGGRAGKAASPVKQSGSDSSWGWSKLLKGWSSAPSRAPRNTNLQAENIEVVVGEHDRPRGVYLYGDVGCGKTFLMDLFFERAPVLKKRRVHFHSFMLDVQRRIHKWRNTERSETNYDPIPPLAQSIALESKLLCFDEFQVTDISDAAILHRLLKYLLLKHNVVLVATSNRPPRDLYQNGINRELFLPCIQLLEDEIDVFNMDSTTDYRLLTQMRDSCFLYPITAEKKKKMEEVWSTATAGHQINQEILHVTGRIVDVPQAANGVARFNFEDLCKKPLGAADYIEIARNYHTVFLENIPKMTLKQKTEARRFITLVDALYEYKVKLLCTAGAPPNKLFSGDDPDACNPYDLIESGSDDGYITAGEKAQLAIHTGEEEMFMFDRCVSRLIEMQSKEYLEDAHLGHHGYAAKYNLGK